MRKVKVHKQNAKGGQAAAFLDTAGLTVESGMDYKPIVVALVK